MSLHDDGVGSSGLHVTLDGSCSNSQQYRLENRQCDSAIFRSADRLNVFLKFQIAVMPNDLRHAMLYNDYCSLALGVQERTYTVNWNETKSHKV